jgi:hypothetical protein
MIKPFPILIALLFMAQIRAAEPIKIPESESPDKRFYLAVYTDKNAYDLEDSDDVRV